jgi:hypothetical protein
VVCVNSGGYELNPGNGVVLARIAEGDAVDGVHEHGAAGLLEPDVVGKRGRGIREDGGGARAIKRGIRDKINQAIASGNVCEK